MLDRGFGHVFIFAVLFFNLSCVSAEAEAKPAASGTLMSSASVSVREVDDEDRREAAVKYKVEKHSCPYFCKLIVVVLYEIRMSLMMASERK